MDASLYRQMADIQATHWWFAARRSILEAVLRSLGLPADARILEAGCGPGGNLAMLTRLGRVWAFERDEFALAAARRTPAVDLRPGWLPDGVPFSAGETFDVICLFDVLEHVRDDEGALRALAALLAPGGRIVVTVPAYQWLFGPHDRAHHHFRRYSSAALRGRVEAAGLSVVRAGYFNALLFPLVALTRVLARWGLIAGGDDAGLPGPVLNRALEWVFGLERHVMARAGFPFGASLLAVLARKA